MFYFVTIEPVMLKLIFFFISVLIFLGKTSLPQSMPQVTLSKPTAITTIAKKELPIGSQKIMIPVSFSNIGTLSSICSSATTSLNPSYQILIATKTHPRIKYSGMKKIDEGSTDAADTTLALSSPAKITNNIGMSCVLTPLTTMSSSTTLTTLTTAPMTTHLQTPITLPIATPIKLPIASIPMQTTITLPLSTTITQKLPPLSNQQSETNPNELNSAISQTVTVVPTSNSNNDLAVKYADIDDIELPDGTKIGYPTDLEIKRLQDSDISTLAEKYSLLAANAIKNFDFSSINDSIMNQSGSDEPNELYACRHCGKRYRWKSTLRRHENEECNGKEPTHKCPYCEYKARQRGNLGVHVRKHHSEKPQLESRRKKRSSGGSKDDVSG